MEIGLAAALGTETPSAFCPSAEMGAHRSGTGMATDVVPTLAFALTLALHQEWMAPRWMPSLGTSFLCSRLIMAVHHHRRKRQIRLAVVHPAEGLLLAWLQTTTLLLAAAAAWPSPAIASRPSPAFAASWVSFREPRPTLVSTPSLAQLPCPLEAGWHMLITARLPRVDAAGLPSGGFSAVVYDSRTDLLELLSDAPQGCSGAFVFGAPQHIL